jgi:hydroxypyruvate isomerase
VTELPSAVNCSILFTETPLLERPAAAKAAGFEAVEFWGPFSGGYPRIRKSTDLSTRWTRLGYH